MKILACMAAALLAGCGDDGELTSLSTPPPGPPGSPGQERAIDADAAALTTSGLAAAPLPVLRLLATPSGRRVVSRVVSCALPRGAAITTITRDGTPYSFSGDLGLAPEWALHAPSGDARQRISACLRWHGRAAIAT